MDSDLVIMAHEHDGVEVSESGSELELFVLPFPKNNQSRFGRPL